MRLHGVAGLAASLLVLATQTFAQSQADIRSSVYRGRPVTYQVIDGLAIYEGDIVLGTVEELEAARQHVPIYGCSAGGVACFCL